MDGMVRIRTMSPQTVHVPLHLAALACIALPLQRLNIPFVRSPPLNT